jgi:serine/threonine protein kinase/Tfp pilus assembly protein PilF
MPQQTISHYRIVRHAGTSLLGEAYLAEDTQLGRKVALLFLSAQFSSNARQMQRLVEEARTISTLNHPNIRMMYEVGNEQTENGVQYFIANEWVEGPTLREHLSATRMRLEEVLDTATQVATGLTAAHMAGVLHRDLKPENVMIRPDGYVKILDFGLAKLIEQDTMVVDVGGPAPILPTAPLPSQAARTAELATGEIEIRHSGEDDAYSTRPLNSMVAAQLTAAHGQSGGQQKDAPSAARLTTGLWWMPGTTGYLSPEQVRGEPVDERSDLFSFGVMIYEMCSGQLPFEGQTTTGVLSSIAQTTPSPIRRFMPDAPEELEWITTKLLAKERDERYQTARELLNDIKRLRLRLEFEEQQRRQQEDSLRESRRSGKHPSPEAAMRQKDSGASGSARGISSGGTRAFSDVIDSLAVLPLANAAGDPTAEYLSDGITESIIRTLSRVPRLRVMARSTVFRYKNKATDPLTVGRELNVRAVFAGRLLQRGDSILIKAELVDAEDGTLLWAEQYQRQTGDVFELEAEIARQISDSLRTKLTGEEQQAIVKCQTDNPEAFDLYLKGRYFWNQRSLEGMHKGAEYFIRAIRKDENYALAYAGMADCYMMLSIYSLPPREFVPKARMAISKALALDDQLAEAHASFGSLLFWYDWEFDRAEQEFRRAMALNPNLYSAHQWCAYLYVSQERFEDGFRKVRHTQALDPLSMGIMANTSELLYRAGRYEEAIASAEKALEMDPAFAKALYWRAMSWILTGKIKEAIEFSTTVAEKMPEAKTISTLLLAIALARGGQHEPARQILAKIEALAANAYVPPFYLAMITANLGDKDRAFEYLEKAYQERSGWMPYLKLEPLLDGLRTDARFSDLLRRIGLQP